MFLHVIRNTSVNECLKTVHCSIHKCWLKLYHAQKKAVCEHHPETPPSFFGHSSSRIVAKWKTFLCSDKLIILNYFGNYKHIVLCTKEEMEHLACHLCTVQKPLCWSGSELVPLAWPACTSGKATSMQEVYTGHRTTYVLTQTLYQGSPCTFQQFNTKLTLHPLQRHGFVEECGGWTGLPEFQTSHHSLTFGDILWNSNKIHQTRSNNVEQPES